MSCPIVSVIIPTLHGNRWMPDCLAALQDQTFKNFEVIIIDNSSDSSAIAVLSTIIVGCEGDIRVLANGTNRGFAAAINQGINVSQAPIVAVLNDDTKADPNWLAELVGVIQENPTVGSCASLMVFANSPHIIQSAGIAIDRAGIAWDRLGGVNVTIEAKRCDIFGASAGAAIYRRSMLDEIGLFDERFFAYLEDVDLAWRAQSRGWRCIFVPSAIVQHQTSATSIQGSPFKARLLGRNKVWLIAKHIPLRDLPIAIAYDIAAVLYAGISRGEWSHLKGRIDGLKGIAPILATNSAQPRKHSHLEALVPPWRVAARYKHLDAKHSPHSPR